MNQEWEAILENEDREEEREREGRREGGRHPKFLETKTGAHR